MNKKLEGLGQATIGAVMAFATSTALAAPLFYNDEALFLADAGGALSFERYESPPSDMAPQMVFPGFTVSESNFGSINNDNLTHVQNLGLFPEAVQEGINAIFYDDNGGSLGNFFSFASGVNAFGLYITTSVNSDVAVSETGGWSHSISTVANTHAFFGVIDDMASFTQISFDASGDPLVGFDSTHYGTVASTVPEPASLALLSLGLLGMGAARRFRARR